jgi:lycopene beta-cyclase
MNYIRTNLTQIISGLALVVFLIVFGLTVEMSYFRLHLFVVLPALWFLLVPPGPIPDASKRVRRLAILLPIPLAMMAVFFSAFWDNLIFSKGVFTFNHREMVGTFLHLPLEEWFWFIDHTFFSSWFLLFILRPESEQENKRLPPVVMPCVMLASVIVSGTGIWMMVQNNENLLFLGVNLGFMFPVLALHWWIGLYILLHNKRVWIVGILVPSMYLLGLDYWALQEGIWFLSPDYITGYKIFDVYFEQILIYTLPSVLVTQSALIIVRQIERVEKRRAGGEVLSRQDIVRLILQREL